MFDAYRHGLLATSWYRIKQAILRIGSAFATLPG